MKLKIPRHIGEAGRKWILKTSKEFTFLAAEQDLLFLAAETLDGLEKIRATLEVEGLQVPDRFGIPRPHPLLAAQRDHRLVFARLCRQLNLTEPPKGGKSGHAV